MFYFDDKELQTKQDYINALNELRAYRELDGQNFDFGTGVIENNMSYGSEDAYYEMDLQTLEEIVDDWEEDRTNRKAHKSSSKMHKRHYDEREKLRLQDLESISWMNVLDKGNWKQRCYRGVHSKYLKKVSNKKVRQYQGDLPPKGNNHRKVFDFWWELY